MEYKQQQYNKVRKARRKRRPRPYTTNRVGNAGSVAISTRNSVQNLVIEPWIPAFPARIVRRLRYCDSASITSTSGSVGTYVLRANDLFDPDFTGTGHQPMGFDQLMVNYNHFAVTKARLVVTFENGMNASAYCIIRVDGDSTSMTVPSRILEMGGLVRVCCEQKATANATKTGELSVDIAKLQGVSESALTADANLRGTSAASPVEITYFHIEIWNNQAQSGAVIVDYTLEQEAVFFEPRNPTQS